MRDERTTSRYVERDLDERYRVGRSRGTGRMANGERGTHKIHRAPTGDGSASHAGKTVSGGTRVDRCAAGSSGGRNDLPGHRGVDVAMGKVGAGSLGRSVSGRPGAGGMGWQDRVRNPSG